MHQIVEVDSLAMPTQAVPGSAAKIELMRSRAELERVYRSVDIKTEGASQISPNGLRVIQFMAET